MIAREFSGRHQHRTMPFHGIQCALWAMLVFGSVTAADPKFFPAGVFHPDDTKLDSLVSNWYSEQLTALREPSLFEAKQDLTLKAYRFLWLRTFHHPVAVRVVLLADGSGILATKMADGTGGYKPGKLIVDTTRTLSVDKMKDLTARIQDVGLWRLSVHGTAQPGRDGAQWVIERVDHGTYQIIDRWSPEYGPVRELGLYFLRDLAGLQLKPDEIY